MVGVWKLANLWGIIENDWLWRQPWTAYVAPVLLLYVGATTIIDSYRCAPDQIPADAPTRSLWLQRSLPIGEDSKRICCAVKYGGIELFVPTHVNVVVKSRSFLGGVGNHATHATDPKAPTLYIVADNFLGGVDIKN